MTAASQHDARGPLNAARWILIETPSGCLVEVPLSSRATTILGRGSGSDCHVSIDDPEISRRHAAIEFDGTNFVVRDLGSQNGMRFRGLKRHERRLRSGDRFWIGATRITYDANLVPRARLRWLRFLDPLLGRPLARRRRRELEELREFAEQQSQRFLVRLGRNAAASDPPTVCAHSCGDHERAWLARDLGKRCATSLAEAPSLPPAAEVSIAERTRRATEGILGARLLREGADAPNLRLYLDAACAASERQRALVEELDHLERQAGVSK